MGDTKKSSETAGKNEKKHAISFGKFHEYVQIEEDIKEAHELTEKEKTLLIDDFKKLKKLEKEEEAELEVIRNFEKKLQELIRNVVYLEGYIQQIEDGNAMLKVNASVKELGTKLAKNIEDVEKFSASILNEEKKILGLAKHVKRILNTAKKYQNTILG
jgi:hypothetical protein